MHPRLPEIERYLDAAPRSAAAVESLGPFTLFLKRDAWPYYARDPDYVAKGPPHVLMRLLAPLLVATTLTVLGTGVGLLAFGPQHHRDLLLGLHKTSFVLWFFLMAVHVLAYAPRLPHLVLSGRSMGRRTALVASSVAAGALLAGASYSLAGPWLHHAHGQEREGAGSYLNVLM